MKKKSILILSLIITVLILIVGCTSTTPTTGIINVNSTPTGAKIYLDGVDTGMATPFTITNVEAGAHVIKLDKIYYKIWEETVIVVANETTYLNPLLTYAAPSTITLQPGTEGRDGAVSNTAPSTNYGGLFYSVVGNSVSAIGRSYIEFKPLTIPANARVVYANLKLYQYVTFGTDNFTIGLYKITGDWDESTITWNLQPTSSTDAEITINITAGVTTWKSWDIVALVQGWLDGTINNYGVVLKDTDESSVDTYISFYTSDYTIDTTKRPKLEIVYYIP
ncbi:hypothetical protein ES705_48819 [subsurface metagenome]